MSSIDSRKDPALTYNFTISLLESSSPSAAVTSIALNTLTDNIDAGFHECTGLDAMLELEEYKAGGVNDRVLKFPTRMSWGKLTLKTGMVRDRALWEWIAGFGEGRVLRRDGLITLLTETRDEHTVWKFRRGLPVKLTGPRLSAAESAVAFESIEIEHEGLELLGGANMLADGIRLAGEVLGRAGREVRSATESAIDRIF